MLARFAWRFATELSLRSLWKMTYLYAYKGWRAIAAYKKRRENGELYPPFMFVALTNTCNLRCRGCWVEKEGTAHHLPEHELDFIIDSGKKQKSHYYTLLGGEPMMYKGIWDVFERHQDCYFQVITNGMAFTEKNAKRIARYGNITPLISVDGLKKNNDERRGAGVFEAVDKGLAELKKNKVFFGVATTVTSKNLEETLCDEYIDYFIKRGALYIWYYVYRPVGEHSYPMYCLSEEQLVEMRKRLLRLRRKHPMLIIDTYWTAEGEAFCPAAMGLGYHIGPQGSIEICPPMSFATDKVSDNNGDMYKTINESAYLKGFESFVNDRTKGCVILEHPQELVSYINEHGAQDYSSRDAFKEFNSIEARHSHHLPGKEIPEDFWFYRMVKKQVFFGMGAAG